MTTRTPQTISVVAVLDVEHYEYYEQEGTEFILLCVDVLADRGLVNRKHLPRRILVQASPTEGTVRIGLCHGLLGSHRLAYLPEGETLYMWDGEKVPAYIPMTTVGMLWDAGYRPHMDVYLTVEEA